MPLLHCAAYNGDVETVLCLLAEGAAADARDESGYTPLLWACFRSAVTDMVPVIQALVAAGADVEATTTTDNCLILAAQSGNVGSVAVLLDLGAKVDAQVDGVTPLMVAASHDSFEVIDLLMEKGADPSTKCGRFTAADYAYRAGQDDLAKRLINLGADFVSDDQLLA